MQHSHEPKTILLTWWTWFIWSKLLEKLIHEGHTILLLKRRTSSTVRIDMLLKGPYNIISFNTEETDLDTLFTTHKIDMILHLATSYKKTHASHDVEDMIYSNVTFPSLLCESAIKHWIKYFINTGTFFEYAHSSNTKNILREESPEKAYNLYASTKLAFNEIVKYYSQNYDFKVINLRLFSPYGPKDNQKLIPMLIQAILQKKEMKLSWWEQQLTFTYVDDIVDAYIKSIDFFKKMSSMYEVFNIGNHDTSSIKEIVGYLKKISWTDMTNVCLWEVPYLNNEIFHSWCDATKAKLLLGWEPKYTIESWLSLTYDYYKHAVQ